MEFAGSPMATRMLRARDPAGDSAAIGEAAALLRRGGLVVIPTETVYGLAANALCEDAVAGIFRAKGRPQDNPLIVHVTSLEEWAPLVRGIPPAAAALAARFWPGPLTIILPHSEIVPDAVSAGLPTVAVRMPSHPVARAVIRRSGLPLAAPSANLSGSPSPTSARHCAGELRGRVPLILDGGECPVGLESTVVTLAGERPRLLRPGAVTLEELESVLGPVAVDSAVTHRLEAGTAVSSPGMKYKHYAPRTALTLVHGSLGAFLAHLRAHPEACALVFDEDLPWTRTAAPCLSYGGRDRPQEQARRLFAALREIDSLGRDTGFVRAPGAQGVGLAVYNRLLRAAGFSELYLSGPPPGI